MGYQQLRWADVWIQASDCVCCEGPPHAHGLQGRGVSSVVYTVGRYGVPLSVSGKVDYLGLCDLADLELDRAVWGADSQGSSSF